MAYERHCEHCACASPVWNGWPEELICVNSPGHAGQMTRVVGGDAVSCRGFRARSEPPIRGEPPAPTDDRVRCIPLTNGLFAIVDAEDYEWLSKYNWRTTGGTEGYARSTIGGKNIFMHRLIMNPPAGMVVDHINQNRWDNRRSNLRVCTQAENLRNRRSCRGTSRFKGVHWNARIRKWVASICLNRQLMHLGYFDTEIAAAHAYDRKARELFGPFAYLNFPNPTRIVLLSGRIEAHSSARERIRVLRYSMHRRRIGMTPWVHFVGAGPCTRPIRLGQPRGVAPTIHLSAWAEAHPTRAGTQSSWTAMTTGPPGNGLCQW
jgi:hypothetical protein